MNVKKYEGGRVDAARSRIYIAASLRRAVYARGNYKCTICKSPRALEIDHIVPVAKKGTTELSNLRLLCRPCNQRHAINSYGLSRMSRYLKEPSREYEVAT